MVIQKWPRNASAAETPGRLRLVCMGQELPDGKTLRECNIPSFEWRTPIHVSSRPQPNSSKAASPASIQPKGTWGAAAVP
jgi:hypothetical protein